MAPPPDVCIFVRSNIDWLNFDYKVKFGAERQVGFWNDVFKMPYHIFRHRLQQLAERNLNDLGLPVVKDIKQALTHTVVIPVDDDDWFSPDLNAVVRREFDLTMPVLTWKCHFLTEDGASIDNRFLCCTNSYAVNTKAGTPEVIPCIYDHTFADKTFRPKYKCVDWKLGATNRTLASAVILRDIKSADELVQRLAKYRQNTQLPGEWFDGYLQEVINLYNELAMPGQ